MRTREFRRRSRDEVVREYFYGKKPHTFFPFSFEVQFSEVQIYKIGGETFNAYWLIYLVVGFCCRSVFYIWMAVIC